MPKSTAVNNASLNGKIVKFIISFHAQNKTYNILFEHINKLKESKGQPTTDREGHIIKTFSHSWLMWPTYTHTHTDQATHNCRKGPHAGAACRQCNPIIAKGTESLTFAQKVGCYVLKNLKSGKVQNFKCSLKNFLSQFFSQTTVS